MARIGRIVALVFGCLVGIAVASWWQLRPPPVAVPARGFVRLVDVTVVSPPEIGRAHQTLVLRDGRIEEVRQASATDDTDSELRAYRGTYVLPGLIDMHFHAPARLLGQAELFSLLALLHGVTSIRDPGTPGATGFGLHERIRAGAFPGPRVFTCGVFLDGDPPVWSWSRVVRDAVEARAAVDELAARGADCIKVYDRISAAALTGVRAAAAEPALPVMGHVPFGVHFADTEISDVQHLTGVAGLVNPRWSSYGEMAESWRALDAERMDAVVRISLRKGDDTPGD